MKTAFLVLLLIVASQARARLVWIDNDEGFALQTAGWLEQDVFQEWLGVKCLLTIPPDGWMAFEGKGALELYFPKLGWRRDIGIIIMHGCHPKNDMGRDSKNGVCGINRSFACADRKDRVMMVVRVRRFNPTNDNKPTKARWIKRRMDYGTENTDSRDRDTVDGDLIDIIWQ